LNQQGRNVRVVSMPSVDRFEAQEQSYRDTVLPPTVRKRIAVEAGHKDFWFKYVGLDGRVVGMQSFGESAPASALMKHFGFTVDNIISVVESIL
jgi:transketolase